MQEGGIRRKNSHPSRRQALAALGALAFCAAPGIAAAQAWPQRPVTAVVPLAAGNAIDIVGRIVLDQMSKQLGQAIVVENRPGAGGTIGATVVAKAAPDGYTILVHSSSIAIAPALYSKLSYDTLGDLVPVIPFGLQPSVLVASPKKGYRNVADVMAAAKAKPGALNYASAGTGSTSHLAALRMLSGAGVSMQHIPYRGPADAISGLLAGEIDIYFLPLSAAIPHLKEGALTALAVSTTKRAAELPDVPTTIEAGLPNSTYEFWIGLFAPAKTPAAILTKVQESIYRALQAPHVRDHFLNGGYEPQGSVPAEWGKRFRADLKRYAEITRIAKIEPQ